MRWLVLNNYKRGSKNCIVTIIIMAIILILTQILIKTKSILIITNYPKPKITKTKPISCSILNQLKTISTDHIYHQILHFHNN